MIGAQRAGTTSLYEYLKHAPNFLPAKRKEVHYFDKHYHRGSTWYRSFFPVAARRPGRLTGEATPALLYVPQAPERVAATLPGARFVALLRDPVQRAFSHYRLSVKRGLEQLPFEEALAAESDRLASGDRLSLGHHSYVARGRYAEQLKRWYTRIAPDRVLIIQSERFFADPHGTVAHVCDFLSTPAPRELFPTAALNAAPSASIPRSCREHLRDLFRQPNEELFDLVGQRFDWT